MTAWELYFLLKLDDIQSFFTAISLAGLFTVIFVGIFWAMHIDLHTTNDSKEKWWKIYRRAMAAVTLIMFTGMSVNTFLPSTKQMAAIMVVPAIVNNEKIQQLPNEVMELLGMSIDKAKEMLEPVKK